jgi:hypothetical protein
VLGLEERLLHVLRCLARRVDLARSLSARKPTHHRHKPEVTFLLQRRLDVREAAPSRLADSLDEEALANAELNADVIRAELQHK